MMIEKNVSNIEDFYSIKEIIEERLTKTENLVIIILDKIEDHNFYNALVCVCSRLEAPNMPNLNSNLVVFINQNNVHLFI